MTDWAEEATGGTTMHDILQQSLNTKDGEQVKLASASAQTQAQAVREDGEMLKLADALDAEADRILLEG